MKNTNPDLVGYVLGILDDTDNRQMEGFLAAHPEEQPRVDLLRRAIEPLSADREDPAPPPDLVYRTLGRVAEFCCRPELPHAPATLPVHVHHRPAWRRAELLVAASLLIIAVGAGISGLAELRNKASYVDCKENLRVLYTSMKTYHDNRKHFPDVKAEAPHDAAGMVVPILVHEGVLNPADVNVRCPGNGPARGCPVTYEQAKAMTAADFAEIASKLSSCYAYSLGYFDDAGTYHAPHLREGLDARMPLMSDRPPYNMAQGNSPNHGGTGQNVLFQDGHVDYLTVRHLDFDNDIFMNRDRNVAAGVTADDACLGPSNSRP